MQFIDANDDLATSPPPFKVIAVIPVLGRGPLVKLTIQRLLHKNGCDKVICVGHDPKDREICLDSGAIWVEHKNKPLGAKWNAGFVKAKQFSPDACLYMGSSDWCSDNWLQLMRPYLVRHGMIGVPGMHLLDVGETLRACKWDGYTGSRADESIGIGRLLSRELLDKMHWLPFNSAIDNSLDRSMKDNARILGYQDYMVRDDRLIALSISTNQWNNKHVFNHHWQNFLPSKRMDAQELIKLFPEANILCESLRPTLVNR